MIRVNLAFTVLFILLLHTEALDSSQAASCSHVANTVFETATTSVIYIFIFKLHYELLPSFSVSCKRMVVRCVCCKMI